MLVRLFELADFESFAGGVRWLSSSIGGHLVSHICGKQ